MSSIRFSTVRDTVVSTAGAFLISVMIVAAAALPAQTAVAAIHF
jgi:hypothetical protein